jgi:hypothetical protein
MSLQRLLVKAWPGGTPAHRAAPAIVLLAMALAATAGLVIAGLVIAAAQAPATSVSTVHVPLIDNCLQMDRPGRPTPC